MSGASSCNTGGAAAYVGGIASQEAQGAQLNNLANPGTVGANNLLGALQSGGSRRRTKSSKNLRNKRKVGGTAIIDIVIPAGMVYANQMYKPKGAAPLYGRSRKLRGSRRHTRTNRRSARKH